MAAKQKVRDKRQQSARIRRYYRDYQVQMRSKMLKRRTKEEMVGSDNRQMPEKMTLSELYNLTRTQRFIRKKSRAEVSSYCDLMLGGEGF